MDRQPRPSRPPSHPTRPVADAGASGPQPVPLQTAEFVGPDSAVRWPVLGQHCSQPRGQRGAPSTLPAPPGPEGRCLSQPGPSASRHRRFRQEAAWEADGLSVPARPGTSKVPTRHQPQARERALTPRGSAPWGGSGGWLGRPAARAQPVQAPMPRGPALLPTVRLAANPLGSPFQTSNVYLSASVRPAGPLHSPRWPQSPSSPHDLSRAFVGLGCPCPSSITICTVT